MSDTIWVDVRGRSKDDVPQDNSIMLRLESQLDQLSTKLNVPKLSEFYDYSELESMYGDFEGEGDEPEDESLPVVDSPGRRALVRSKPCIDGRASDLPQSRRASRGS